MSILSQKRKGTHGGRMETLIGGNTEITGDVKFMGGLYLEGRIVGNVEAKTDSVSTINISERGCIEGELRVPRVILNGKVDGDVHASGHVELHKGARVTGNVYYSILEIMRGAEVNGKLVHKAARDKPLLEDKSTRRT